MPVKPSSDRVELGVRPRRQPHAVDRDPPGRFTIVMLGDFIGRANRGVVEPLHTRRLLHVDVDSRGGVFTQLGATLRLTGAAVPGQDVNLTFASLDDFHPDKLLAKAPWLAKLTEARRLALNPATVDEGKAALQAYLGAALAAPAPSAGDTPLPVRESDDETIARLMGGGPPPASTSPASSSQVDQFIRQVVAQHVPSAHSPWRSGVIAAEMELTGRLRAMLHHPDVLALEAAWRGVDMLVRRIESSEEIGLYVLDASFEEVQAELAAHEEVESSTLCRLLRDRNPGLLVGNYTFGRTADDLGTLGRLAEIAATLSAPFVASAAPILAGVDAFAGHPDPVDWTATLPGEVAKAWAALRQSGHARYAGLAAPRFMVRQPYGKGGDAIETFPFEESPADHGHESFPWGHPGVLCACAVIDALQAGDTDLSNLTNGEIGDMPVHTFTENGEVVATSCAEAWLTDRAVDRLIASGIIPIVAVRRHMAIRLVSLPSISRTPAALEITSA
jgi:type VI secretion system protein ImpC